jgi:hypothetical protein
MDNTNDFNVNEKIADDSPPPRASFAEQYQVYLEFPYD